MTPDLPGFGLAAFGAKIEIVTSDGRSIGADQSKPAVPSENVLRQMVEAKFFDSAKGRITSTNAAAALAMLRTLEYCSDLHSLTRLLAVADDAQLDRDPEDKLPGSVSGAVSVSDSNVASNGIRLKIDFPLRYLLEAFTEVTPFMPVGDIALEGRAQHIPSLVAQGARISIASRPGRPGYPMA